MNTSRRISVLAVLALLFALSIAAMWIRNCYYEGQGGIERLDRQPDGSILITIHKIRFNPSVIFLRWAHIRNDHPNQFGRKVIGHTEIELGWDRFFTPTRWDHDFDPHYLRWEFLRFGWYKGEQWSSQGKLLWDDRIVIIPDWFLIAAFGVPPFLWLWSIRRARQRERVGHCQHCGYSLTGNTSGVCPECGTAVSSTHATASDREASGPGTPGWS